MGYCHAYGVITEGFRLVIAFIAFLYTARDYSSKFPVTQIHYFPQSRLHCRCLVAIFGYQRRDSPFSGLPYYPFATAGATPTASLLYTIYRPLQDTPILLSVLCLHQSLLDDGSQGRSFLTSQVPRLRSSLASACLWTVSCRFSNKSGRRLNYYKV
jgi:hypothetical protein